MSTFRYIAPLGTTDCDPKYLGRIQRKPWETKVLAVVPHLETLAALEACLRCIRAQTVHPDVLIIDTGSRPNTCARLEDLRQPGVEISYIRSHAWRTIFEPVCVAMDLAFALCRTEYLYATHADCFPMRRDWLEDLLDRCNGDAPVVGYRMTDRSWAGEAWQQMVSHSATMFHMPTMRQHQITWSYQRWLEGPGQNVVPQLGWPDTEVPLNQAMHVVGIQPVLFDGEQNWNRTLDGNIDHVRCAGSFGAYHYAQNAWHAAQKRQFGYAIAEAHRRAATWEVAARTPG